MCYFGKYSHIFHYLHQKHCIVMLEVLIKDVVPVNHEILQTLVRVLININLITIGPNLNHRQSNANIERTIKLKGNNINTFWKCLWSSRPAVILYEVMSLETRYKSGAPNENIVQNHINIALLNVF